MELKEVALLIAQVGFPPVFCFLLWRYIEKHGDQEIKVLNAMCIKLDRLDRKLSRPRRRK